jgi:hypothetical protein
MGGYANRRRIGADNARHQAEVSLPFTSRNFSLRPVIAVGVDPKGETTD